jgi:hypothetical protein
MKLLYSTLIFTNLVLKTFAQELPEVPLKNGLAFYKFDHTLENTNDKCVSSFFTNQTIALKILNYAHQLSLEKSFGDKELFIPALLEYKLNCIDTIITQERGFNLSGPFHWVPNTNMLTNKNIISYTVRANIQIVFTSKVEYSVYFKNVSCNLMGVNGQSYIYDLGELYTQVKNSTRISKKDVKLFEELNYFIQATDEIILKSLVETINLDQL